MEMNNQLQIGSYAIPPDCTAKVVKGMLLIRKKRNIPEQIPRCRDCAHYGQGKSMYHQHYLSNVCFIRPKTNGLLNGYPESARTQQRYYSSLPSRKACEKFQPKNNKK